MTKDEATITVSRTDLGILVDYFLRTDGQGVIAVSSSDSMKGGASGGSGMGMSGSTYHAQGAARRLKEKLNELR